MVRMVRSPHDADQTEPTPAQLAAAPPADYTPQQLNLLQPKTLKRTRSESRVHAETLAGPPAIVGRILGICESSTAIGVHTVLLVFALANAHESGAAAVGLFTLALSHPALLYPVFQWYSWRMEVSLGWQGATTLTQRRSPSSLCERQSGSQCGQLVHPAVEKLQWGQMPLSKGSIFHAFERQPSQMPQPQDSVLNATTWRHSCSTRSTPTNPWGHESSPPTSGGHALVHPAVSAC